MRSAYCPRLSDAKALLPRLRAEIVAAAPRFSLPAKVSLELLPIVEDGVFGYELVPSRDAHTYLTIGFSEWGAAVVRRTLYSADAPGALRLAAASGKVVGPGSAARRNCVQQRDSAFANLSEAIEHGFAQYLTILPERPREPIELQVDLHRYLDEALVVAYEHLSAWDPFIHFFGLPLEAEFGFALRGARGEHGELISRRPDMWVLRWKAPKAVVYEEWAVAIQNSAASGAAASA